MLRQMTEKYNPNIDSKH